MTQQAKTQKQVQIIARYFLKKSGIVCYAVRSSNGTDTYRTCVANGRASCTCPGFEKAHRCYHSTQILALEQSRSKALTPATYDIVGEALQVVNAEIVSQRLGDAYEQVGDPRLTREQYVNMFGIYE